jgi:phage shock protein C
MNGRLHRSETNKMIGGVCGGLGSHLDVDPVLVRLFFVLLAFGNGIGVLLYIVLWIIMPSELSVARGGDRREVAVRREPGEPGEPGEVERRVVPAEPRVDQRQQSATIIGAALILVGVLVLVNNLGLFWLRWINFDLLWPLLLVAAGFALIWRRVRE